MKHFLSKLLECIGNGISIAIALSLLIKFPIITGSILAGFMAFVFYLDYVVKKRDEHFRKEYEKRGLSEQEINMIMSGPEFMV